MIEKEDIVLLRRTAEIARSAMLRGNHPFGSLLADREKNILLEQGNAFREGGSSYHAETLLCLKAAKIYSPGFLSACTLYTNFEPCCMCAGAVYWANIGRIVYALSEEELMKITGESRENPTLSISSRYVISKGRKAVVIEGPVNDDSLRELILKDHLTFWKDR